MDITTYTTYAEVRSTVGLATKELPDTVLALEIYGNALSLAMSQVTLPDVGTGTFAARYAAIKLIVEASRTVDQQAFYDLTRMFATYAVAVEVAVSLSMRAPKMIGDSKASLTRFSPEATFQDVARALSAKLASIKYNLENIGSTAVESLPYLTVVPPDIDVITGE